MRFASFPLASDACNHPCWYPLRVHSNVDLVQNPKTYYHLSFGLGLSHTATIRTIRHPMYYPYRR